MISVCVCEMFVLCLCGGGGGRGDGIGGDAMLFELRCFISCVCISHKNKYFSV